MRGEIGGPYKESRDLDWGAIIAGVVSMIAIIVIALVLIVLFGAE